MRVLVTGGSGFIGSNLVDRLLQEGYQVDVIDDLSYGSLANLSDARSVSNRQFSFHRADVTSRTVIDLIAHRKPEVIFHLASRSNAGVGEQITQDAQIEILGSLNVLAGALAAKTRKVIYASDGAALYGVAEEFPVSEGSVQHPISSRGVAKKATSDYLYFFRQVHDLEFTTLAIANTYGPRQRSDDAGGVVSNFIGALLKRDRPLIEGDGDQTRDFVYVDDVAEAFVAAVDKADGLLVNIGTGVETSIQSLHDTLSAMVGADEPPRYTSPTASQLKRCALDPTRASIHLGWQPETELKEGLARTVQWMKASSRRIGANQ